MSRATIFSRRRRIFVGWCVTETFFIRFHYIDTGGGQDLAKIPIFGLHVEISNVGAREIGRLIRGDETG